MPLAIALIVLATGWRIVAAHFPVLVNFSPLMALAFCGAVYFPNKRLWLVPFAALTLSDLYLDHYYATTFNYEWTFGGAMIRALCFAAALGLGAMVARDRSWLKILGGALGGSLFFYLVTNTASFLGDSTYMHTSAGWWQAMTVGHPEFPPTILFFRNTLVSDLVFTGVFATVMEYAALHAGRPSLLAKRVPA
ncbi:MAG: DUF6580 family putative transport protein [Opitutaceae bacterium]